ncbi:MAG: flavodoxin [Planctomycetes bacterium]|nr:flavodoxin [Planctomycetota bacterium]
MKTLLVLYSFHHNNTEKIAKAFAQVLDAQIKAPQQIDPDELQRYDLVGFGSGIYSDKHHRSLFTLVEKLPRVNNKKAFIFSTSGAPAFALDGGDLEDYVEQAHSPLREKLQSKGYTIVDEFICPGHNTNKFLKVVGGLNKGRPNAEDLKRAEEFAQKLEQNATDS